MSYHGFCKNDFVADPRNNPPPRMLRVARDLFAAGRYRFHENRPLGLMTDPVHTFYAA